MAFLKAMADIYETGDHLGKTHVLEDWANMAPFRRRKQNRILVLR